MGWLSDFFSNPIQTHWDTMLQVPGSPEAATQSVIDGSGSDGLSWNMFNQDGPSVWDRGFLGYKLSDQDKEREHGRMFGRAAAAYLSGGYSEVGLSPMEIKAKGGSDKEAFRGGLKAAALASANNYIGGLDAAGYAGIENPILRGAVNGALAGGTTSTLAGGNFGQGALKGGVMGGLKGYTSSQLGDEMPGSYTSRDADGELIPSSQASDGFIPTNYGGVPMDSGTNKEETQQNPFMGYMDRLLGNFKTPDGSWNGQKIGQLGEGLMGLYGGYKQQRMARGMMRGLEGRRSSYETNLRNELLRKDAAAGRRSNYDGRATEIQGRLAQLDAQQMPMVSQLGNSSLAGLFNMLKSGYSTANSMGAFSSAPQQQQPYLPSTFNTTPMGTQNYSLGQPEGNDGGLNPYSVRPRNKLFGGS
jgi:hypothetical protein